MKTHVEVSSQRRKGRRAQLGAPSNLRYKLMSAHLSKDLRKKYNVRALPVRKDDEVTVVRGTHKGTKGKVSSVYRKRWVIQIEKLTRTKANGMPYQIPIRASQCIITKPYLNEDRKQLLARKASAKVSTKGKGEKHTTESTKKAD
ncbi:unnamed protein product (macronuclear) [Paramecium tetraurelia]|uniref:KOW domain-containing protein n=1 Tax=Paramecium tetraurelia TaxID=5888 RepID=A0CWM8_PARTE|nr:uncharacterized protein GSPATT00001398001 [Paramecium tetraurelia]CAK75195.1 unnamed protein product [Paramecium tetraurelia]|eukprot:XP_001442592.1 hypothetical protein (macronuclear) [Paramecium tetraurelia strain d4-2]